MSLACLGVPGRLVEVAELVVSELVTNAVVHGQGDIGLFVSADERIVRIEVSDAGAREPRLSTHDDQHDQSGRGLSIVQELARAWGVETQQHTNGKTVWCELDRLRPRR
ncbi:MAG: ATP-binding protein [Nocardioidaceae bacterium]